MSIADTYGAYADAFEEFYEDGETSRLKRFFTEDAVYLPGDGQEHAGRDRVFDCLAQSIDGLDKKFDRRELTVTAGPDITGNQVSISWTAAYSKADLPDLIIHGREIATFEGDAMCRLEDILDAASIQHLQGWLASHGERLG